MSNLDGRQLPQNQLATFGYWTTPVQRTVKKWKSKQRFGETKGEELCRFYLPACALSAYPTRDEIHVPLLSVDHRQLVIDLLVAVQKVYADRQNPDGWLLQFGTGGSSSRGYRADSYEDIQKKIRSHGGPNFSSSVLAQRVKRLRLNDKTAS